jgi:DNA invertase Pin-like site-specific DNA recombinase
MWRGRDAAACRLWKFGCRLDIPVAILYRFLRVAARNEVKTMASKRKRVKAVAYTRTSSATNVGADRDSEKRQRAAIIAFARANGYEIADDDWYYDPAVRGDDRVAERPGFAAMLDRIASNGVRVVIVESPDRFARDLAVQLTGHDFLLGLGITLIPTTAPDFFVEETPTAVLVRQVLGAISQFEKASLVAKLKAARDRKKAETGKCGGRSSYAERDPQLVALARELATPPKGYARGPSLRKVSAGLAARGYVTPSGVPYSASAVRSMLGR